MLLILEVPPEMFLRKADHCESTSHLYAFIFQLRAYIDSPIYDTTAAATKLLLREVFNNKK